MYQYPLNPIQVIDPMGLDAIENMTSGGLIYAVSGVPGLIAANSITNSAYQFGYDMDAIVGGAHNGAADAMRHCYLMCRMTKTFGSTIADVIGKIMRRQGIDKVSQLKKESWILKITLSVLLVAIFLPNVAMHVLKNITLGNSSG
ncbi:RHS protein [Escherichia coli]|nr:RHS protein [Escherichia coli]